MVGMVVSGSINKVAMVFLGLDRVSDSSQENFECIVFKALDITTK